MNISRIMTLAAAEIDDRLKERLASASRYSLRSMIDRAGNLVRDHGGTEAEIRTMRAQMRAWLERGGEALN